MYTFLRVCREKRVSLSLSLSLLPRRILILNRVLPPDSRIPPRQKFLVAVILFHRLTHRRECKRSTRRCQRQGCPELFFFAVTSALFDRGITLNFTPALEANLKRHS